MSNGDFICVETYSGYRRIAGDPQGAMHLLPPDADNEALGTAILDSLARSRFLTLEEANVFFSYEAVNKRYTEWVDNLMQRYEYKGKRALFENMKACGIECQNGLITIRPSNHEKLEGWSGDGISKSDHVIIPSDRPAEEIGAALRLALSRCI